MADATPSMLFSPAAGTLEHAWVLDDCPSGPDGRRQRFWARHPGNASCVAINSTQSVTRRAVACCAPVTNAPSPARVRHRRQPTCPRSCPKRPITDIDGALATWAEARAECLAQGRVLCTRSQIEEGAGCSFVRQGGGGPLWSRSPCGNRKTEPLEYVPVGHMPPQCTRGKHRLASYANLSLGGCIQRCEGALTVWSSIAIDCATVAYNFVSRDCRLLRSCEEHMAGALTFGRCEFSFMLQPREQLNDMMRKYNVSLGSPQERRFQWCHYTRRATVTNLTAFGRRRNFASVWREARSWHARPADPTREAYATVWCGNATSAYFSGFKVLLHSIRRQDANRPIIVLTQSIGSSCAPAADVPQLEQLAIRHAPLSFERVSFRVRNHACVASIRGQWHNQNGRPSRQGLEHMFLKFALWNITRYHRIVCIDSDAMVLRSLEMLWSVPLGADEGSPFHAAAAMTIIAKPEQGEAKCRDSGRPHGNSKFNTGLLVIKPNATFYQRALQALVMQRRGHMSCNDGDQSPYNLLFRPHTRCISHSFNCYDPYYITNRSAERANLSGCIEPASEMPHIVHFAMTTKPWHPSIIKQGLQHTSLFYQMWADARRIEDAATRATTGTKSLP